MANDLDPLVNQWYRHLDKGQRFYVTDVDEDADFVEVQHFDSDLEEYTLAEWRDLEIELSEAPENWSGAMDLEDPGDSFGQEVTDTSREDWEEPGRELRRPDQDQQQQQQQMDSFGRADDYGEGYMEEDQLDDNDQAGSGGLDANVTRRPDGVFEESFNDNWYAEYSEDPDSGLWRADLYKQDVPEWRNLDFESMEDAMLAAREYYSQA